MPGLYERYQAVSERIAQAAQRAGRDPGEVRLIAVSKTKPYEMLYELAAAGVLAFGENKVQELDGKAERFEKESGFVPEWHMIGHLQRNKVRVLAERGIRLIHSVDSLRLAEEIEKACARLDKIQPVLIEVNIGQEESKSGVRLEDAPALAASVSALPHLRLEGLMCVAPAVDDPELVRPCFRAMRALRDELSEKYPSCRELSMGMTGDFEIAVEEGATMVRVGSAIFGARDYSLGDHAG